MASLDDYSAPGDEEAPSPASSVTSVASSCCSAMSMSSDAPSPASSTCSEESGRRQKCRRRRRTPYEVAEDDHAGGRRRQRQRQELVVHLVPESVSSRWHDPYVPAWDATPTDNAAWHSTATSSKVPQPLPPPKATHRPSYNPAMQAAFTNACKAGDRLTLDGLLRRSSGQIDVDLYGDDGRTALHRASADGQLPLVRLLVAHGADTQLRTREGWSAVHLASFAASGGADTVAYLLRSGRA